MEKKTQLSVADIQKIALDIMKDIDRFCRANAIPYTLSSGTLLGAVRHGGFIPWDDDTDMFMLRKDFDRFVSIYKSDKYKLVYYISCGEERFPYGFAKVCDRTTVIENPSEFANGVFVDVFPLDNVPENPEERKRYMHRVMSIHNRVYHRRKKDIVSIIKSYRHSLKWWLKRLDDTLHEKRYVDSPLVAHIVGASNYRTVIHKERFKTLSDISFEGHDFLAFSDPHSYLEKVYGSDYMTPKKWAHNIKVYKK